MYCATTATQPSNLIAPHQGPSGVVRKKKKKVKKGSGDTTKTKYKKQKEKDCKQNAVDTIAICSCKSDISEDSTLSGHFDNSAIFSDPRGDRNTANLSTKPTKQKRVPTEYLHNHVQNSTKSSPLKKDQWTVTDHGAENSATPSASPIDVDYAIQVGLGVLRALESDETLQAIRKKNSRKKKKSLNIIEEEGKRPESVNSRDAIQEKVADMNEKLTRRMSTKSFDTAPSIPCQSVSSDSLGDITMAFHGNDDSQTELNGKSNIPLMVDIGSHHIERPCMPENASAMQPRKDEVRDAKLHISGGRCKKKSERTGSLLKSGQGAASDSLGRRKRLSLLSKQPKKGKSQSPDQRRRLTRSTSNDKKRSKSLTSEIAGIKVTSKRPTSIERKKSKGSLLGETETLEVQRTSTIPKDRPKQAKSTRMLNVKDRSVSLCIEKRKSKSRREYRKSQSERSLGAEIRSVSKISSIQPRMSRSMTRREYRKAQSERHLDVEDHLSSYIRSALHIDKPRSMTRRDFRKVHSERQLQADEWSISNQSSTTKLSQHLPSAERRCRRPSSECSLGGSIRSTRSLIVDQEGSIMEKPVGDVSQIDSIHWRGRRPDRAPHQRSHSVDGASMRLSTSRPKPFRSTVSPDFLSISSNHSKSMKDFPKSSEHSPSLARNHMGSLRNLLPSVVSKSPRGSVTNLFRRKDRYVDVEGKESRSLAEVISTPRSESLALEPYNTSEALKNLPAVGPLPLSKPIYAPPMPPLTPVLKPSRNDSIPYSSTGTRGSRRKKSKSTSPEKFPRQPAKSLPISQIDYMSVSRHSQRLPGDAAVASMSWEPSSSPAIKSPTKRRAKKGEKLKRLLHLTEKLKSPLTEQQQLEEEDDDVFIPLHILDSKREIAEK
jgi:hypothetical protein